MDKEELEKITAQLAHPSGEMGAEISDKMNDANAFMTECAIKALSPKKGDFIVELGPGNGALSRDLVDVLGAKGNYLGIEISSDMAMLAEKTLRDVGSAQVEVHNGDCHTATVNDASVDGLMAVNVLYFIDDLHGLLTRIRPWIKPNGRCVFGIRSERTLKALHFDEFGYYIRPPEDIEKVLRLNGFCEINIERYEEEDGSFGDITFPKETIIIKASVSA